MLFALSAQVNFLWRWLINNKVLFLILPQHISSIIHHNNSRLLSPNYRIKGHTIKNPLKSWFDWLICFHCQTKGAAKDAESEIVTTRSFIHCWPKQANHTNRHGRFIKSTVKPKKAILLFPFLVQLPGLNLIIIISNSNWTEWSTIQGVVERVIFKIGQARSARPFEITSPITPWIVRYQVQLLINRNYNKIREEYYSSINYLRGWYIQLLS